MANEMWVIDANAFKNFLEEVRQDYLEEDTFSSDFAAKVIETVQDEYLFKAPTVDAVEVVHGQWIPSRLMVLSDKCSVCHGWVTRNSVNERKFRYCPHCGAKMDGDGNA